MVFWGFTKWGTHEDLVIASNDMIMICVQMHTVAASGKNARKRIESAVSPSLYERPKRGLIVLSEYQTMKCNGSRQQSNRCRRNRQRANIEVPLIGVQTSKSGGKRKGEQKSEEHLDPDTGDPELLE